MSNLFKGKKPWYYECMKEFGFNVDEPEPIICYGEPWAESEERHGGNIFYFRGSPLLYIEECELSGHLHVTLELNFNNCPINHWTEIGKRTDTLYPIYHKNSDGTTEDYRENGETHKEMFVRCLNDLIEDYNIFCKEAIEAFNKKAGIMLQPFEPIAVIKQNQNN